MFQHASKHHPTALVLSLLIAAGATAVGAGIAGTSAAVADSQWGATPATTVSAASATTPVATSLAPVDSQWG